MAAPGISEGAQLLLACFTVEMSSAGAVAQGSSGQARAGRALETRP